jgi:hypothetical protein
MLMVDIEMMVWAFNVQTPLTLQWEEGHIRRAVTKRTKMSFSRVDLRHRVADLVAGKGGRYEKSRPIAALAIEHLKLHVAENEVADQSG